MFPAGYSTAPTEVSSVAVPWQQRCNVWLRHNGTMVGWWKGANDAVSDGVSRIFWLRKWEWNIISRVITNMYKSVLVIWYGIYDSVMLTILCSIRISVDEKSLFFWTTWVDPQGSLSYRRKTLGSSKSPQEHLFLVMNFGPPKRPWHYTV